MSERPLNYTEIAQSGKFRALMAAKKGFLAPVTAFFFAFYFALPLMTSYTTVLNTPAVGSISWAWIFAFAQFIMTWALCGVYTKRAAKFDVQAAEIVKELKN